MEITIEKEFEYVPMYRYSKECFPPLIFHNLEDFMYRGVNFGKPKGKAIGKARLEVLILRETCPVQLALYRAYIACELFEECWLNKHFEILINKQEALIRTEYITREFMFLSYIASELFLICWVDDSYKALRSEYDANWMSLYYPRRGGS